MFKKAACFTDIHFGLKNNSRQHNNDCEDFVKWFIDEAKKFVYSLGASRLDELLSSQTEEAIRALVYGVPAMRVHDLREEFAIGMLNVSSVCRRHIIFSVFLRI